IRSKATRVWTSVFTTKSGAKTFGKALARARHLKDPRMRFLIPRSSKYGQCAMDKWLLVAGQEQLTNKHLSIANAEMPNCEVQIACHPDFTIYEMVKWL
ncbi:hypothetical protein I315_06709, partial [Cryptococcus gattii Ru294]